MYPRFVEQQIKEALGDTRVILITGPVFADKLLEIVLAGGFPEAIKWRNPKVVLIRKMLSAIEPF